jgi:hypothetical protein
MGLTSEQNQSKIHQFRDWPIFVASNTTHDITTALQTNKRLTPNIHSSLKEKDTAPIHALRQQSSCSSSTNPIHHHFFSFLDSQILKCSFFYFFKQKNNHCNTTNMQTTLAAPSLLLIVLLALCKTTPVVAECSDHLCYGNGFCNYTSNSCICNDNFYGSGKKKNDLFYGVVLLLQKSLVHCVSCGIYSRFFFLVRLHSLQIANKGVAPGV